MCPKMLVLESVKKIVLKPLEERWWIAFTFASYFYISTFFFTSFTFFTFTFFTSFTFYISTFTFASSHASPGNHFNCEVAILVQR
jgi:hypothetical protein